MKILRFQPPPIESRIYLNTCIGKPSKVWTEIAEKKNRKILYFDQNIPKEKIELLLAAIQPDLSFSILANETLKSRQSLSLQEDLLIRHHVTKDSLIIAMGGGVLSDMIGFLASTYMRGLNWILIPSTLLSMADASIGGKTAINVGGIKNIIGSFYPASQIIIDPTLLSSLEPRQMLCGLAEIIKYGCIYNPELFEFIEKRALDFMQRQPTFINTILDLSIEAKMEIVTLDPFERGIRCILNFGHTIGHAFESYFHFTLTHGEAIAAGMIVESLISFQRKILPQESLHRIIHLFKRYSFDLSFFHAFNIADLIVLMQSDKKAISQSIRMPLIKEIGTMHQSDYQHLFPIHVDEIHQALMSFQNILRRLYAISCDSSIYPLRDTDGPPL
ncbi:MAG: 3-dehydroquinate synthase [Chlamydiae bacterium]|nr:3-dehydroquinate synthase [Chlamydiota bacterium]